VRKRFDIYCDILYWGLLNIRNHADDPKRCFAEADHLHNLPELLRHFENEELHQYYWDTMRPSFINQSKPEWLWRFEQLWAELQVASRTGE